MADDQNRFNDKKFGRLGYKCGWEFCNGQFYGEHSRDQLHQHLEQVHSIKRENKPR